MKTPLDRYLESHCTLRGEGLDWIERQTNIRTNYPQMLSGRVQGQLLKMLVEVTGASRVLEIGTFTGYSAACLAMGLPSGGQVDTLEINDEMESVIREGWERCGVSDRISLHIGDALDTLGTLAGFYDLAFVDADKRQYSAYLEALLPLVRQGGLIVVDDVLRDSSSGPQGAALAAFGDSVASDPRLETVFIPLRHGLALLRKL